MTDRAILAPAVLDAQYGSDQPDGAYPRTVRHFGGHTVLTDAPSRFVSISTGNLDGAVALGIVPIASTHNNSGGFVPDYIRTATRAIVSDGIRTLDDMIDVGLRTAPDLAAIAALEPTLITASYRGFGGKNLEALEACGPTVLPEGKGFNWKQDLLLLGSATARLERARGLLDAYAQRVGEVAAAYVDAGSPTVSVARFGPLGLETHGTWSFCGSVLSDVGVRRPPSQHHHVNGVGLDPESSLGELDAELLLYTRVAVPASAAAWEATLESGWFALPVVESGRSREVDAASWHGNAGILAAFAVLDEIAGALDPA